MPITKDSFFYRMAVRERGGQENLESGYNLFWAWVGIILARGLLLPASGLFLLVLANLPTGAIMQVVFGYENDIQTLFLGYAFTLPMLVAGWLVVRRMTKPIEVSHSN